MDRGFFFFFAMKAMINVLMIIMDTELVDYLCIIMLFYKLFGHPFTAEDPLVNK